jgi:isochorismate pyruvate lyase
MREGLSPIRLALALVLFACATPAATADETTQAYWGKPSVDGGKCCNSLAEVRDNIDRIDHEIVTLMAERQKYVGEAGRFKANPAAVSAPARVEQIIVKVRGMAKEAGLSEEVAEKTFRAMIAGFEDYERDVWNKRNAGTEAH